MKKMTVMIGIIISFITIIGAMFALDARWTRANVTEELRQSLCNKDGELLNKIAQQGKRLDQYIAQDRYDWLEQRKHRLEDRYVNQPMPQTVKEEYRKINSDMKKLEKKLDKSSSMNLN